MAGAAASYAMNRSFKKSDGSLYYDDIPDYIKDSAVVLLIPGTEGVDPQGNETMKFLPIPVGQLGVATTPVLRLLRELDRSHPEQVDATLQQVFGAGYGSSRPTPLNYGVLPAAEQTGLGMLKQFSPIQGEGLGGLVSGLLPPLGVPFLEAYANKDFYRGTPVVGPKYQNLPPEWQTDPERTSAAGTALAGIGQAAQGAGLPVPAMFRSPIQADYLLQGTLGGPGQVYAGLVDVGAGQPEQGIERASQATWKRIVRDKHGQINQDVTAEFFAQAEAREQAAITELQQSALFQSVPLDEQQSLVAGLHARAQSATLRAVPPNAIPDYLKDRVAGTPTQPGEPPKYVARRLPADVRGYYDGRYGLMAEDMSRASDYIALWKRNRRLMAPPSPWQRRLALLANRTNPAWERWNARQGRLGRDVRQSTLDAAVAQAAS
jgi:hypothetical protein